ncbi:MAG: phosphonate/organophosphate ester transporter subunit [Rhodospirillaceae bacterium BRH_c57]|nr:MAG: phosphonate/organophosphate ester transporter subunit [Rhodospirillaceae bacterium BRH_c57]
MAAATFAIEVSGLSKSFRKDTKALDAVSLRIDRGEMVALIGASGSGKSTLLRHISGLTAGNRGAGSVRVLGKTVQSHGRIDSNCRCIRAELGFVFQQFNLVNRLSVLTNVLLGTLGRIPGWRGTLGLFRRDEKFRAMQALARVGIAGAAAQRASTLSGGQQQRAAIARALVQQAQVILADEPIASLDPASSGRVMDALATINREDGITVLVSLHQVDYAIKYCPRTIAMRDGQVVFDGPSADLTPDFLHELYGADSEELILGRSAARRDEEDDDAGLSAPVFAFAASA